MHTQADITCSLIVPCYNEAARLNRESFESFSKEFPNISIYFVNDGSSDGTQQMLQSMQERNPFSFKLIYLERNSGKAEACRQGMNRAIADGAEVVGYWDADLSTPLNQVPLLFEKIDSGARMVLGSRVNLLGRNIKRTASRHYLGRCFATAASLVLGIAVYDTQCGAKLFLVDAPFKQAILKPFSTGWIFDVELIARLLKEDSNYLDGMVEFPLHHWCDVAGSKVKPHHFFIALLELMKIWMNDKK